MFLSDRTRLNVGDLVRCKRCKAVTVAKCRVGLAMVMSTVDGYGAAQVCVDHAIEFCAACATEAEYAAVKNAITNPQQEVN